MSLAPEIRTRIETLLRQNRVVLFMKGSPSAPRCGFSAAASGVLNELLPDYATVDVLDDPEIREGIKQYGNWPTIPQLYVGGELVGGSDIIQSMYGSGELHELFGVAPPDRTPPSITISDKAAAEIRNALAGSGDGALFLSIDPRFQAQFQVAEADPNAIRAEANGITLHMDPATAQRARGIRIDWIDTVQGSGLSIDNPNAPAAARAIGVGELKARLDAGDITLVDVRPPEERARAALHEPFRTLDDGVEAFVASVPKDAALAFLCHTGARSARAAEHFRGLGFAKVYNVAGGIDAWAREVDPSVARY